MTELLDKVSGLVCIFMGLYVLFRIYGPLPVDGKKREDREKWRRKWGKSMKIFTPIVIILAILLLLGIL